MALSHSSIVEETLAMREKLQERNAVLKCAQRQALKANEARALFRRVTSGEMKEPVAAVSKVFSTLQLENLNPEQLAMARGGLVLSSLLQDMADVSTTEESKLEVSFRPFALQPVLVEAVELSKLLCCCRGIGFECAMIGKKKIPAEVVGDERHIPEAVLSMISHLLGTGEREPVSLRIFVEEGSLRIFMEEGFLHARKEERKEKSPHPPVTHARVPESKGERRRRERDHALRHERRPCARETSRERPSLRGREEREERKRGRERE